MKIGATILYDLALIIGIYIKVYPDMVYINNRTTYRQVQKILGKSTFNSNKRYFPLKNWKTRHIVLEPSVFPSSISSLSSMDIENLICTSKNKYVYYSKKIH